MGSYGRVDSWCQRQQRHEAIDIDTEVALGQALFPGENRALPTVRCRFCCPSPTQRSATPMIMTCHAPHLKDVKDPHVDNDQPIE